MKNRYFNENVKVNEILIKNIHIITYILFFDTEANFKFETSQADERIWTFQQAANDSK